MLVGGEDNHPQGSQHVYAGSAGSGRVDVVSGVLRRRRWSREEKTQILAESFALGANVSDVARRYNVSLGLVHNWRRAARQGERPPGGTSFVRVLPMPDAPLVGAAASGDVIEIDIGGACVRVHGQVDHGVLRAVISLLRSL